jgi:hypothetical protein
LPDRPVEERRLDGFRPGCIRDEFRTKNERVGGDKERVVYDFFFRSARVRPVDDGDADRGG